MEIEVFVHVRTCLLHQCHCKNLISCRQQTLKYIVLKNEQFIFSQFAVLCIVLNIN